MTVIDVHTHMLTEGWVKALQTHGGPRYSVGTVTGGQQAVHFDGAPFMTLTPGMFDYGMRIQAMDAARVDIAIVSLTCPNVFWGPAETSLATARAVNDDMARAQATHPSRIRWLCSLPWQHADLAIAELARACDLGAVGVMTLANIDKLPLIDPAFSAIWAEIDRRGLPVLVHPTAPPGMGEMDLALYGLVPAVGFMIDTTLAIARMIYDGFFDRYVNLKIIAGHGGATIPYLAGRLDQCFEHIPNSRARIKQPPSTYLRQIYYDSVVYAPEALQLCIAVGGPGNVLYGSDYPHNIGDMTGCLARVDALASDQSKAVRGGNAQRIFRI